MPFNNNNNNKEKNATREPAGTAIELNALDYVLFFLSLLSLPFSLSLSLVPPPPFSLGMYVTEFYRTLSYQVSVVRVCVTHATWCSCAQTLARAKKKEEERYASKEKKGPKKPPFPSFPRIASYSSQAKPKIDIVVQVGRWFYSTTVLFFKSLSLSLSPSVFLAYLPGLLLAHATHSLSLGRLQKYAS